MKGSFSPLTIGGGWTVVYATGTCFSETTSDMCHVHPRFCAPWSCGCLLMMSARHLPYSSSLRGQKRTAANTTKAMVLLQTWSQEWFITLTQTCVVSGQPVHTLKPPQMPLSNSEKFRYKQGTYLFPYHVFDSFSILFMYHHSKED